MRENRTYGSEGGEPSNGSLPYPYRDLYIPGPLHTGIFIYRDLYIPLQI